MLGLKRGFFPTVLIAMRKNLLPYLSVSEPQSSVFKCLTKRDKVWVNELMLIMLKTMLLSQRLWISVFQCTRLGSLFEKKKNKEKGQILPLFSVRIYLLLFIMTLLLKLFFLWDQILGGGKSSQSTSRLNLTSSCFALKILAQHLHIPKRLLFLKMGCVSSFWRFFLKCILCTFNPIRYCNNTGTFHPLGLREGNRAKK